MQVLKQFPLLLKHSPIRTFATSAPPAKRSRTAITPIVLGLVGVTFGGLVTADQFLYEGAHRNLIIRRLRTASTFTATLKQKSPELAAEPSLPLHLQPQSAVTSPVKNHALFLTIWLKKRCAVEETASHLASLAADLQSDCSIGFSEDVYSTFNCKLPSGVFIPFAPDIRKCAKGTIPATGGSIFVHCKSDTKSECYATGQAIIENVGRSVDRVESVFGFKYVVEDKERDLLGTLPCNSTTSQAQKARDGLVETTGGSYVLAQQWKHVPDRLRKDYLDEIVHDAPDSHVHRVAGYNPDCTKIEMVRQGLPSGDLTSPGTFFVGYSKDPLVFSYMLDRMTGHPIRGRKGKNPSDRIFEVSQCARSQVFYVPSVQQLQALTHLKENQ